MRAKDARTARLHPHDQDEAHGAPHRRGVQGAARRQPVAGRDRRVPEAAAQIARGVRRGRRARRRSGGADRFRDRVLRAFLPKAASDDETRSIVRETLARLGVSDAKQSGRVVGDIMKTNKGKLEPATVKRIVEEELGAPKESWPPAQRAAGSSFRRRSDGAGPAAQAGSTGCSSGRWAVSQPRRRQPCSHIGKRRVAVAGLARELQRVLAIGRRRLPDRPRQAERNLLADATVGHVGRANLPGTFEQALCVGRPAFGQRDLAQGGRSDRRGTGDRGRAPVRRCRARLRGPRALRRCARARAAPVRGPGERRRPRRTRRDGTPRHGERAARDLLRALPVAEDQSGLPQA